MHSAPPAPPSPPPLDDAADASHYRSGAVAQMLRMPVATLRVWERRYALTKPQLSPGGQRLYTAEDVRRLAMVKQLTALGHPIGSLAAMDLVQLQRMATTHAQTRAAARPVATSAEPAGAWRLAVIGAALGTRLQRSALLRGLGRPVALLGPFNDTRQAAAELAGTQVDAVLIHEPQLHQGWLEALDAAAPALATAPKAVLYRFAADPVCEALAAAGAALLREPQPDAVVAQWLRHWSAAAQPGIGKPEAPTEPLPPRRWDTTALADFARQPSAVACECPRHVAELLVQLMHFEAYSAECAHRSAADAALHAQLQLLAARARVHIETALDCVALHEGLLLPAAAPQATSPGFPAPP
jgi:MerR family transcriptional regulator, light-induced transcriptional regulator